MKAKKTSNGFYNIYCPGCKEHHSINVEDPNYGAKWSFNGDIDKPTFSPSLLVTSGHHIPGWKGGSCWCTYKQENPNDKVPFECSICHSFIREGKIQFLNDCTHELAGQTVDLPEL